eukprot:jgi/Bigna1/68079/fgenesh1_pg.5_\
MAAEQPPRKKIGVQDFEFKGLLGEGSYAKVYLAQKKSDQCQYAAKMVNIRKIQRLGKSQTVMRERKCLAICDHPNIVKLHFSFRDTAHLYFVLELISGGELFELIVRLGKLPFPVAQFFTAEILDAVGYLHSKGILHRDLKPENLLVTQNRHLKLTDFGTAGFFEPIVSTHLNSPGNLSPDGSTAGRGVGGRGVVPPSTDRKSCVGTAEYVAPEILDGKAQTAACDIWSIGCIIYHMLVGKPPFKGKSDWLTFKEVKAANPTFPEDMPQCARDLLSRIFVTDPSKRIGSKSLDEIKRHSFFKAFDWDKLREMEPPTW